MILPVPKTILSKETVEKALSDACSQRRQPSSSEGNPSSIRPMVLEDMTAVREFLQTSADDDDDCSSIDSNFEKSFVLGHFYGVVLEKKDETTAISGVAIFYFAYSTWDSRYVYLNRLQVENDNNKTTLLCTLADFALSLQCQRLVWQHYKDTMPFYKSLEAENLKGWLTLRMDIDAMESFLKTKPDLCPTTSVGSSDGSGVGVVNVMDSARAASNRPLQANDLLLHRASAQDVEAMEEQVMGLAVYEKEPESVHVHKEHYLVDGGFDNDAVDPLYYCLLLQDTTTKEFHGIALFYFGYDCENGRFLYLEDLFIEKPYRGKGGGMMLMYTLASIAYQLGCSGGFVWQALDWNTPALGFYQNIGAKIQEGLLTTRFNTADRLREFVDKHSV